MSMLAAFADPVFDSQRNFRELLQAMARPGTPRALPALPPSPPPATREAMAVLLTLCDQATPVWLQQPDDALAQHLRFHAGTPLVEMPAAADFALITDARALPPLHEFALGDPRYPDRSSTLIVQVDGLRVDTGMRFAGPGIREVARCAIDGLPDRFWHERAVLAARLPLGLDCFFVAARQVLALPRTTRLLED